MHTSCRRGGGGGGGLWIMLHIIIIGMHQKLSRDVLGSLITDWDIMYSSFQAPSSRGTLQLDIRYYAVDTV